VRQVTDRDLVGEERPARDLARPRAPEGQRHARIAQRRPPWRGGIHAQLDEAADALERVTEDVACALDGAVEVAHHREAAAADAREVERGAVGAEDAAMDLGHLEIGVDLRLDA
jgi:hypothetical protein